MDKSKEELIDILEDFELERDDEGVLISEVAYPNAIKRIQALITQSNKEAVMGFVSGLLKWYGEYPLTKDGTINDLVEEYMETYFQPNPPDRRKSNGTRRQRHILQK